MKQIINRITHYEKKRRRDRVLKRLKHIVKEYPKLSREDRKRARQLWKAIGLPFNLRWHRFYTSTNGRFDPRYVPEDLWNYIEMSLDPPLFREVLQHKGFLYQYLPEQVLPELIAYTVNGNCYLKPGQLCCPDELLEQLKANPHFVMKRAAFTGGGHGFAELKMEGKSLAEWEDWWKTVPYRQHDFVFQRILKICPELQAFNPFSTNTLRMVTFFINGKMSYLSSFLRVGGSEKLNDNACTGGVMIPVRPNGELNDFGFLNQHSVNVEKSPTGVLFKGCKIKSFEQMKLCCMDLHQKYLPYMGFVAWDVTVDEQGQVRIIELNLDGQEVFDHQRTNGPLFGGRTEELIAYIAARQIKRLYTF